MNDNLKNFLVSIIPGKTLSYLYLAQPSQAIKIESLKLVYIPIPKVANRSIKSCLAHELDMPYVISAHKAKWDLIPIHQLPLEQYYTFAFVRNPLDRLVSCYNQKFKQGNTNRLFWKYGKTNQNRV